MSKVLITGGTGLIGRRLTYLLTQKNHEVIILSRNPKQSNEFEWNPSTSYIDDAVFKGLDYIIHLAGAGIADERWSSKRKKIILDSRVKTADLLFTKVNELNVPLKGFLSASGIGYYGAITSDHIYTEEDEPTNEFISEVCVAWEKAALQFESLNIPVSIFRTGIVLAKNGGALKKMLTPIISPLGSGKQYMPWIHIDDLCNLYIWAIEEQQNGIFNAVCNEHHTNRSFSKALAKQTNKPYIGFPVPSFALKIAFGELASILLEGSRVSAQKIVDKGFTFKFPTLKKALHHLF